MGAALAAALAGGGREVGWASAGRSPRSAERARRAGLRDAGELGELLQRSAVVLSVCPPHAALEVAAAVAAHGYGGLFVDANAIAPRTARQVAARVGEGGAAYVDGAIVGPPPAPRLYLSGERAEMVAALFAATPVAARTLAGAATAASALKACYAAWTKGSAALLLAAEAAARRAGVGEELAAEWTRLPGLEGQLAGAHADALAKGWRWVGEMEEIAVAFADLDLPAGFHEAAATVFAAGG